MPHFSIEYSDNLEALIDISALCDLVRRSAIDTGVFPMPGIRVRAYPCRHYSIADGAEDRGFIDISVRLRGGRSLEVRKQASNELFDAVQLHLSEVFDRFPLALSMEMRDIDPELSPKCGSIRNFLPENSSCCFRSKSVRE